MSPLWGSTVLSFIIYNNVTPMGFNGIIVYYLSSGRFFLLNLFRKGHTSPVKI